VELLLKKEEMLKKLLGMFAKEENDVNTYISSIFSNMSQFGDPIMVFKLYK
jgi:hypothetical protein